VNELPLVIEPAAKATTALARRADFLLGHAKVRPSLRTVEGPLGAAKAEPRVLQVLVALADARGGVLSRDDLLRICWGGRIVGDDAINRAVAEVRRLAVTVGAEFTVETVPRIGFRLVGVDWDKPQPPAKADARGRGLNRRMLMTGGVVTVAVLTGAAGLLYRQRNAEIDALVERGRVLQGLGGPHDDQRAETLFREAIHRDSKRADAWGWLAVVLRDNGKAREAALNALAIDPREPNARTVLAFQRRDLDAWTQWEDALLDVLADAPDCAPALDHLTLFYQGMGRCGDSWKTNERAIGVEPFNPSHRARRVLKHWIFGRIGEADKVADSALELWPRVPQVWNARMLVYAFTGRAQAALALLDDAATRPVNLTSPSVASWRAALNAIATRSAADITAAVATCTSAANLAPGLAANAIMVFSYLGELDAAYRVAEGLLEGRGPVVQRTRGVGIKDFYSTSNWGRTQFLFIPATSPFRADPRFSRLCQRMGHVAYWRRRGIWPDPFVRGVLDPAKLV
jgi:DNA-binding winged helix-turn-helix (wHTH) protein